ncbi:MAG: PQQ-like beta-propeller repeat protein [Sedimentisphaerales bacterium]|nr:PQQ-like beta-propeller repeat protein [Sedimentisphaerales bacterium]
MSRLNQVLSASGIFLCVSLSVQAAEWPQWRGPNLNGSTTAKNLPATIEPEKNILWSAPLPGPGFSTPVIVNQRVFLTSQDTGSNEYLALCIDTETGKILWQKAIGSDKRMVPRNLMATPSPVTDGKSVWFLFGNGDLTAMDIAGNPLWKRNLEEEYDILSLKYGYSSSPLLYEGRLYIPVLRRYDAYRAPMNKTPNDSFLLCVEAATGKNIFKQLRPTDALEESQDAYSTPIPFDNAGRKEILVIGADYVTSHDPLTGRELWRYDYATKKSVRWRHIPSVVCGEGLIFGVRSRGSGLFAIRPQGRGLLKDSTAWTFDGPTPDSPTPLYDKGLLYVPSGRREFTCLDAKTGQQKWQGRVDTRSPFYASITGADDKLYTISENGEFYCFQAGGEEFKILGQYDFGEKPSISSIAVAYDRLFIRTGKKLYCIGR